MRIVSIPLGLVLLACSSCTSLAPAPRDEPCAVLVLVDGLRWQEVFSGAEEANLSSEVGGIATKAVPAVHERFWRASAEERRAALMPFFWSTIAKEGQLLGNREKGSTVRVTNGLKFSYPGYSEMVCGFPDARIDSNKKVPNPNVSALEWLAHRPGFEHAVAAIGAWDVVPSILNRERCGFPVYAAFDPIPEVATPRMQLLDELKLQVPAPFDSMPYDAITVHAALEYLRVKQPRVMWLTLGETDEWAHSNRYDEYLVAAQRTDAWIAELWSTLQSLPRYKDKTTLIVAADHGRGNGAKWTDHGHDVDDAEFIWIAALGPRVSALGERTDLAEATQSQIAATLAASVGEDWCSAESRAGCVLPQVLTITPTKP